jgi:hypothetical protein
MDYKQPSSINRAGEILRQPIPVGAIPRHIQKIIDCMYDVAEDYVNWLQLLHEKRAKMLWPKEKDKTELDRKTFMDASVAVIEKDYEMLGIVKDLLERKLDTCQVLLMSEDYAR